MHALCRSRLPPQLRASAAAQVQDKLTVACQVYASELSTGADQLAQVR